VRLVREELRDDQAVVGFCGGPFTVAGYLVGGEPSRGVATGKAVMCGGTGRWHALMGKLGGTGGGYGAAKGRAGGGVVPGVVSGGQSRRSSSVRTPRGSSTV